MNVMLEDNYWVYAHFNNLYLIIRVGGDWGGNVEKGVVEKLQLNHPWYIIYQK